MKMITIVVLSATLMGCGLDRDVLEQSKAACHRENGEVSLSTMSNGTVLQVNCTIDGITYRVGSGTGNMYDGSVAK